MMWLPAVMISMIHHDLRVFIGRLTAFLPYFCVDPYFS